MLSKRFSIGIRKIKRAEVKKSNLVTNQVRKILADTDQRLILMVRG